MKKASDRITGEGSTKTSEDRISEGGLTRAEWAWVLALFGRYCRDPQYGPHLELWRHKKHGKLLAVRWEGGKITGAVRPKRRADGGLPVVTPGLFHESPAWLVILAEEEQAEHEIVWSLIETLVPALEGWRLLAAGLEGNVKERDRP